MKNIALLIALSFVLSACSSVRETLGIENSGPDEFDVAAAPPLAIPPEFTLRPPEPGAPRPQAVNPQTTAKEILTGSADAADSVTVPSTPTAVEDALLSNAGTAPAPEAAPTADVQQAQLPSSIPDNTGNAAENASLKTILEAPVTPNEPGKPAIEMAPKDGGNFWDSWF